MGTDPTLYGLPAPNQQIFEAHPTQSVELPLRSGSGERGPRTERVPVRRRRRAFRGRHQRRVRCHHLRHGVQHHLPVLRIWTVSYGTPGTRSGCTSESSSPGFEPLAFIGFAQAVPTLFPFVECQSRLLAAYAVKRYALPPVAEMERVIDADQKMYVGHCTDRPVHIRSRSTTSTTSTTSARGNCPPASSGRMLKPLNPHTHDIHCSGVQVRRCHL